jgi:dipeptidyl aminopeptidase/acylaminoacyl peptidase
MKYFYFIFVLVVVILVGGGLFLIVNQQGTGQVLSSNISDTNNVRPSKNVFSYISDRDGNQEVYLHNIDSKQVQRVTTTSVNEFDPVLGLNATKLAFFSEEDGFFGIWIYSLESYEKKLLSITKTTPQKIKFSPDGLLLAYIESDDENRELYILNTRNGSKERAGSYVSDFSWGSNSLAIVYTQNLFTNILKTEMQVRTIAENGELEDPKTIFVGGVAPVFIDNNDRIHFIDVNGENISVASTSLRGEDYLEDFQIKIEPKDGILYQLLKHPSEKSLILTISSNEQLIEVIYLHIDEKYAIPLNESMSSVIWNNNGEITYTTQDDNGSRQIWIKESFESLSTQLTKEFNNWF